MMKLVLFVSFLHRLYGSISIMPVPRGLSRHLSHNKMLAVLSIAIAAAVVGVILAIARPAQFINDALYDRAFKLRATRAQARAPVIIITADELSKRAMAASEQHWGWPWPRQVWGMALRYVQECGGRAAAVDLLFPTPSQYNGELDDDATFAEAIDQLKMPTVFATEVQPNGLPQTFAPPVKRKPVLGAVNLAGGASAREYAPSVHTVPSLASEIARLVGKPIPEWAQGHFRMQFYGPHADAARQTTYPYVSAVDVFGAMRDPQHPGKYGIDPSIFRGKIVLFGATAAGTFDLKSTPVDPQFPGVELHATAIENIISDQHASVVSPWAMGCISIAAAVCAALGATLPRRMALKFIIPSAIQIATVAISIVLFRRAAIIWFPPAGPLASALVALLLSLAWNYLVEDRQSRFFLRALGQYVSPEIASELRANPALLSLSATQRELTILFSDIVGFTTITEKLGQDVGPLLNYFLDEMSMPILAEHGTVDKYVGDAIMSFWNAPLEQKDHAIFACRAALAMQRRLEEIRPRLGELGAPDLQMRIGINTGPCVFGNMGSRAKFNYSVIGDACNLASRLEGANKIYQTRILIGPQTWTLVWDRFVVRKIDVMRVKGKQHAQPIYELIGEGLPNEETAWLINQYEQAFSHYCLAEWDAASIILLDIQRKFPQDGPTRELMSRIADFRRQPRPELWDGVFVAKEK